jgi:2-polyprenyl-3-methyl-5-hydroxy-6-metoxy-1,4-benzoquinol methylase
MHEDRPPPPDWDARFSREDYLFGTAPNEFLVRTRDLIPPGGRVLSVADGEGRNSTWLAQQGFAVDAFDGSPVGVAKAERLAAERGVSVSHEVARVDGWRWPGERYDAVVAIFIQFSPPTERRRVFADIHRALRPGGLLLLEGYSLAQLAHGTGGPRVPDQLYTEQQLRAELAAFSIEALREYEAEIHEGPAHSGFSAVIDVVARRPRPDGTTPVPPGRAGR